MPRYFIEVSYHGDGFAGFQRQQNANTIQGELEKAMFIYLREEIFLTGSSRTDAGVHARQNFLHFDSDLPFEKLSGAVYHLNSILPRSIAVKQVIPVNDAAHCRFDALSRSYSYYIHQLKDPFLNDRSHFYPYKLDLSLLNEAADIIRAYTDFESFCKRSTQVHTYLCEILESRWIESDGKLVYQVTANRFLRGMVRGLVGTMLKVGTGKIKSENFRETVLSRDPARVDFSVPGRGLYLEKVSYPFIQ